MVPKHQVSRSPRVMANRSLHKRMMVSVSDSSVIFSTARTSLDLPCIIVLSNSS